MGDDEVSDGPVAAAHVRDQARSCAAQGSPLYGSLLDRVADDVAAGGPAAAVVAGHEHEPRDSALALRLAGAVHRVVLEGRAPRLAAHYPSTGGDGDADAAWPAFRAVLADHADEVREALQRAPQTNEVGRCAALWPAVLRASVAAGAGAGAGAEAGAGAGAALPVRLWEVGTSAGLNLRADAYRYQVGAAPQAPGWGPRASPVVLDPAWEQAPPWLATAPAQLDVVERVGADPHLLDPASERDALTLASYVWPDQLDRLARLRGALAVARRVPVRAVRTTAAALLDALELSAGALTVVQHSVVWQYLPASEQQHVEARLQELGAAATAERPLAHVAVEPRRLAPGEEVAFWVVLRTWPGGQEEVLGEARPHGVPVRWGR